MVARIDDGVRRDGLFIKGVLLRALMGERDGYEKLMHGILVLSVNPIVLAEGDGEHPVVVPPCPVVRPVGGVEVGIGSGGAVQTGREAELPVIIHLTTQVEGRGVEETIRPQSEEAFPSEGKRKAAQPLAPLQLQVGGEIDGQTGDIGRTVGCAGGRLHVRLCGRLHGRGCEGTPFSLYTCTVLSGKSIIFAQVAGMMVGIEALSTVLLPLIRYLQ